MKRLTTFLLAFLFAFVGLGQNVLTYDGKVLTYDSKVLHNTNSNGNGWTPLSISDCEFWFDGQDELTFTLNGTKVITWADKSGNSRDVTQANDALRPTWTIVTGRVTFPGNDMLRSAAFGPLAQPSTVFVLFKLNAPLDNNAAPFDGLTDLRRCFLHAISTFRLYAGVNLGNGATDANDHIHTGEFNGAASNYWIDGVLVVGPGDAGNGALDGITIGARGNTGFSMVGEIMEVFGYSKTLTAPERANAETYLTAKWSLSIWLILLLIPNVRKKELEYKIAA